MNFKWKTRIGQRSSRKANNNNDLILLGSDSCSLSPASSNSLRKLQLSKYSSIRDSGVAFEFSLKPIENPVNDNKTDEQENTKLKR
jgi:hypothetical protein